MENKFWPGVKSWEMSGGSTISFTGETTDPHEGHPDSVPYLAVDSPEDERERRDGEVLALVLNI
jgi:hypothetical protein